MIKLGFLGVHGVNFLMRGITPFSPCFFHIRLHTLRRAVMHCVIWLDVDFWLFERWPLTLTKFDFRSNEVIWVVDWGLVPFCCIGDMFHGFKYIRWSGQGEDKWIFWILWFSWLCFWKYRSVWRVVYKMVFEKWNFLSWYLGHYINWYTIYCWVIHRLNNQYI